MKRYAYLYAIRAVDLFELYKYYTLLSKAPFKNRPHPVSIAIGIGPRSKSRITVEVCEIKAAQSL